MNSGSLPLTSNCDGPTWRRFSLKNFMLKVDPLDIFPGGRFDGRRWARGGRNFMSSAATFLWDSDNILNRVGGSWWDCGSAHLCATGCGEIARGAPQKFRRNPRGGIGSAKDHPPSAELTTTFRLDQLASSLISQQAVHYSQILRNYTMYSVGGLASRLSPIVFLLLDQNSDALVR